MADCLPRGKFEVDESHKASYKASKTQKASQDKKVTVEETAKAPTLNGFISYNDLNTGSQLMGAVSAISRDEVILNLPFNMIGHCSLSQCVPVGSKLTDLSKSKTPFVVGQLVKCVVLETGVKGKHTRVTVSLQPSVVNAGLSKDNVSTRMWLSAFVSSEEKHGFCLDFGTEGLTGFLPTSDISSTIGIGSLVHVAIVSVQGSIAKCSATYTKGQTEFSAIESSLKASECRAGFLVNGKLKEKLPNGDYLVNFCKGLTGVLPKSYAGFKLTESQSIKDVKDIKCRVMGVINQGESQKFVLSGIQRFALWQSVAEKSADESILKGDVIEIVKGQYIRLTQKNSKSRNDHMSDDDEPSKDVQDSKFDVVDTLVCHWSRGGKLIAEGSSNQSKTSLKESKKKLETAGADESDSGSSDEQTNTIQAAQNVIRAKRFNIPCRIIGSNVFDGCYIVSCEPKVISDDAIVSVASVAVGSIITGTISQIDKESGVIVKLSDSISGRIPKEHLTDIPLKAKQGLPPSVAVGAKIKVKVLSVDPIKRHITLTAKKSLVTDSNKTILLNTDAEANDIITGYVARIDTVEKAANTKKSKQAKQPDDEDSDRSSSTAEEESKVTITSTVYVNFYGSSFGVAKVTYKQGEESAVSGLKEGSVARVRVLKSAPNGRPIKLTFDLDPKQKDIVKASTEVSQITEEARLIGDKVGVVSCGQDTSVEVRLAGQSRWLLAKIPSGHLADVEVTAFTYSVDQRLVVIGIDKDGTLIVSNKKSLRDSVDQQSFGLVPSTNSFCTGYIVRAEPKFILVSTGPIASTGIALLANIGDRFVDDATKMFSNGQSVAMKVMKSANTGKQHFSVGLKKSLLVDWPEYNAIQSSWLLAGLKGSVETYGVGKVITDAKLKAVKPYGKLFSSESMNNWTLVAINDNLEGMMNVDSVGSATGPLLVVNAIPEKKVLEVVPCTQQTQSSDKKRPAPADLEYTLRLQKDSYAVATGSDNSVVFLPRSRADKEAGLACGASVRLTVKDTVDNITYGVFGSKRDPKKQKTEEKVRYDVGQVLNGPFKVASTHSDSVEITLPGNKSARLHICDLPELRDSPLADLQSSEISLDVKIVEIKNKGNSIWVVPSVQTRVLPATAADVSVGSTVSGYVVASSLKGVFVALSRTVTGRIALKSLKPRPATENDVRGICPVGKLMLVKIGQKSDTGLIDLVPEQKSELDALTVGLVVAVEVKNKQKYGVFVNISGTGITALCPLSELGIEKGQDASKVLESFRVGQKLLAEIVKVENGKVWASLKNAQTDLLQKTQTDDMDLSEDDDEDDVEMDGESDEEDSDDDEEMSVVSASESEAEDKVALTVSKAESKTGLISMPTLTTSQSKKQVDSDFSESSSSGSEDEPSTKKAKKQTKKERLAEKAKLESSTRASEDRTVAGDWRENPETVDDFERLILSEGDKSSDVWAKYIAHWLRVSEVNKAREVAERAVARISAHLETDKFNTWLSYLNLEANFGDASKAQKVFARACQFCESEKIHQALPGVWERAGNASQEESAYDLLIKKFGDNVMNWLNYFEHLFNTKQSEKARSLVGKAMKMVDKKEHVRLNTKLAQLEFRTGSSERGKTLFDDLLLNHPKRTDIWMIYIDEMIRAYAANPSSSADKKKKNQKTVVGAEVGVTIENVRHMFERGIGLGLKPLKTKSFFKKWIDFEEVHGGDKAVQDVKDKVSQYIESLGSSNDQDME